MTKQKLKIEVQSEIGSLNAVLLHRPGAEVENMTPLNVQRALYSDILNLSIAQSEYEQLYGVLSKVSNVYEVRSLLIDVLEQDRPREDLIRRICTTEDVMPYYEELMQMKSADLARVLIEGLPARINTLTAYLKNEYYALYPLYNFYFTRDAAVTIGNQALVCRMANKVRMRESFIMDAIYRSSGAFECSVIDANYLQTDKSEVIMEGGDILVAREDILIIGNGVRTTPQGIDFMIDRFRKSVPRGRYNVIVQQLPSEPESFIHLDMVFTLLDNDKCMVFKPLITQANQYQTVHIIIEDGRVFNIHSFYITSYSIFYSKQLHINAIINRRIYPIFCTFSIWIIADYKWLFNTNTNICIRQRFKPSSFCAITISTFHNLLLLKSIFLRVTF